MASALFEQITHQVGRRDSGELDFAPGALVAFGDEARALTSGETLLGVMRECMDFACYLAGPGKSKSAALALMGVLDEISGHLTELVRSDRQQRARAATIRKAVQKQAQSLASQGASVRGLAPTRGAGVDLRKKRRRT